MKRRLYILNPAFTGLALLILVFALHPTTFAQQKLWGTTTYGGAANFGTIGYFDQAQSQWIMDFSFGAPPQSPVDNGSSPSASLTFYNGKIYGTTYQGGIYNAGVLFEYDPVTKVHHKLHDFNSQSGFYPVSSLTELNGKLYGVTQHGGTWGYGVLFEWDISQKTYTKKIEFKYGAGGSATPVSSPIAVDNKLYGTTMYGNGGYGDIYLFDPATNAYEILGGFNYSNGCYPQGPLVEKDNVLYGMTVYGGYGYGVLYAFDLASRVLTKKVDFHGIDGAYPYGGLTYYNGRFYGLTSQGGVYHRGNLFEWNPQTNAYTSKINFDQNNGANPIGTLMVSDNHLHGVTKNGGSYDRGVYFEYFPDSNTLIKRSDFNQINGALPGYVQLNNGLSASYITISSISPMQLYPGMNLVIDYKAAGFTSANKFVAELSDASGSFGAPVFLGSVLSTGDGSIPAVIPTTTPAGSGYRIRIVSTEPSMISQDNGTDLTIFPLPTAVITGTAALCSGESTVLQITTSGVSPWTITYQENGTPAIIHTNTPVYSFSVSPTVTTDYVVTSVTDGNGYSASVFSNAIVTINPRPAATINGGGTICPGGNLELSISISGTPPPWIVQYTDGSVLYDYQQTTAVTSVNVTPVVPSTYTLVSVKDQNCSGQVSGSAVVDIHEPLILEPLSPVVTETEPGTCGKLLDLYANATGTPKPEIIFTIDDVPVQSPYFFPGGITTVVATASNICDTETQSFTVTVENEPPVITSCTAPLAPVIINTTMAVIATFVDTNASSGNIIWGDGNSSSGIISGNTISGTHEYTVPGVYTLGISLVDACGSEVIYTHDQYVVVYDPYGGFVTGGGWFYSLPGSYIENPSAEGKATFGFVSKYQKGSTIPTGNTDFQFHAGAFKFKSTSYEWLVVAGYKAMFKGFGEINGMEGYGFLISAIDGDKNATVTGDKFRIKIWLTSTETVVYDNQLNATDDAEAITNLGGGSIVIQSAKTKGSEAEIAAILPETSVEFAAYPNPFTDNLTISFVAPTSAPVSVFMHDLNGRMVYSGQFSKQDNGIYQLSINPGILSSPVYVMKVIQGPYCQIVKLIHE